MEALPTSLHQPYDQDSAGRVILPARFMLPDMSEHSCRVTDLTPESAILLTDIAIPPGVQIVSYFDEIGRVEAETGERTEVGLRIAFQLSGPRLERLTTRLRWVRGGDIADRRHERIVPDNRNALVTMADGRQHACEIIDISLSGAAIKIELKPDLGSQLILGKTRGRVVRHIVDGIAIEFVRQLDWRQLRKRTG